MMRQEFMSMKEAEKIVKKLEKEDVFIKEEEEWEDVNIVGIYSITQADTQLLIK